jgi:hypothetical protein
MIYFYLIQSRWTCTRHVPKRCTLINVINKCCTLSVSFYLSVWILTSLRQGLHVVALLGLPPRCRESSFGPGKSGSFQLVPEPCLTVGRAPGMVDSLESRF